tara:strand:- start:272 stop:478 length:207 start_codon:yes stop_codon:yes gene_type:complete
MKLVKVEGYPDLYRDVDTGAIINKDTSGYQQYLLNSSNRKNSKKEIEQLKSDVNEIKSLLKELINGSK